MANKSLFASAKGRLPGADAQNAHGAPAYRYSDRHALAQLAVTGTFGGTFYQSPEEELDYVLMVAEAVAPRFLAQAAIYARQVGGMKDMPAVLLAILARRDPALFRRAFGQVVDSGRMLRTFVQVVRSGSTGRKSLGSAPKAMVQSWLNNASDRALLNARIGQDPSLADVLKMVHPKPETAEREAFYAWILGKPCNVARLPEAVQAWLLFRKSGKGPVPEVPFQMLTQLELTPKHWARIARNGSWQMVRQNLNTFHRQGVFGLRGEVQAMAAKLRDPERIARARVFPYQLMVAAQSLAPDMPAEIRAALHDAMEIAVENVPRLHGYVVVAPDVSGSMTWPVTGTERGKATAVRHVDVAALMAASILRQNRSARLMPFDTAVRPVKLEPRDTILTNAERLARLAGGGTTVSAPLAQLNAEGARPDLVVLISDNQSWVEARSGGRGTAAMTEWERLKRRNPKARLVCLDIAPYGTTQVASRGDVLNIGGFSDAVFGQIADFATGRSGAAYWTDCIEAIDL